jgi:hypothetical protein
MHFLSHGQEEDRDPSKAFVTRFPVLGCGGGHGRGGAQILGRGQQPGRPPGPDVVQAEGGPLAHFVAYGQHEGRDPSAAFSTAFYAETYGHLLGPLA